MSLDATEYSSPVEKCCVVTVRVSSPFVTSSTLITSAPRSAKSIVAVGPASTRVKSKILRPSSGGGMPGP